MTSWTTATTTAIAIGATTITTKDRRVREEKNVVHMSGRTNEESVFIAMSPSRIDFFTFLFVQDLILLLLLLLLLLLMLYLSFIC